MQVISVLRVTETVAGFNGDLLWEAVDSVDNGGEFGFILPKATGANCSSMVGPRLSVVQVKR